ncbi:MAG: pyridoxal phosphate-dependent aminotransferase [Thermovirgaceae bacterium]
MKEIRLHMNEMPWEPPPAVIDAARTGLQSMNRYCNEQDMNRLQQAIADYSGVPARRVLLSPGSDMLLRDAVHLFSQDRKVITLCPSFLPTTEAARQTARSMVRIRLCAPDFSLDKELLENEISGPTLGFFDIPNNPTGNPVLSPEEIESLLERKDLLFIADEAYFEFSGVTCSSLVTRYPNLLVTRTLDKVFSLAGARLGYGIAGDIFLDGMSTAFTYLSRVTVLASLQSLQMSEHMLLRVQTVCEERNRLYERLLEQGIEVFKSSGNFLLVRSPDPQTAEGLQERGILVKDLSDQMPPGYIRVTVGKPEENDLFVREFLKLLDAKNLLPAD